MSSPITLVAVGDLQLGDSPTTVGYGFYSRYRGTPLDPLFDQTRQALAGADVLFGNLETTLAPPGARETSRSALQMRGELPFITSLQRVGFHVLNVANNHAVQHGDGAFQTTVDAIRAAGMACCGVRGTAPWTSEPAIVCGKKVGVLGYCLRPRQWGPGTPPYAEGNREEICADVRRLRALGTTVVVSLHWGEEFVPMPSTDEIELGHAIIDAGASLVLGHHPHVTRPAERYKDGVIAYSLGNFMGDMIWYTPFREGAILRCGLSESGVTDVHITKTRLGRDYRPVMSMQPAAGLLTDDRLRGMERAAYERAIRATWRDQRLASYASTIWNLPRIPRRILAQLALETARNKLHGLVQRLGHR